MSKAQKEANIRILCDLGRTRIRLALANDDLRTGVHEQLAADVPAEDEGHPLILALRNFARERGVALKGASLIISVPTAVMDDNVQIPLAHEYHDRHSPWSFSREQLRGELGLRSVAAMQDMFAIGLALPILVPSGGYELVGSGVPAHGAPVVITAIRTGLGALGLVTIPDIQAEPGEEPTQPIQSEAGFMGLTPTSAEEHDVMHALREDFAGEADRLTILAHDVLSGGGIVRLHRAVAKVFGAEISPSTLSMDLVREAAQNGERTIRIWSLFFGSYARNLALTFGARGGLYIAGQIAKDYLALESSKQAFLQNFGYGGPFPGYLKNIPCALLEHPNPYLIGLTRWDPNQA